MRGTVMISSTARDNRQTIGDARPAGEPVAHGGSALRVEPREGGTLVARRP